MSTTVNPINPTVIGGSVTPAVAVAPTTIGGMATPVAAPVTPVAAVAQTEDVSTSTEKAEKVARLELPIPTELAVLETSEGKTVTIVEITEALAYSQIVIGAKSMKDLEYVAGNKSGMILIDNTNLVNQAAVAKYIAEGIESELVLVKITYGDYAKLRLSAASTGKAKVKKSARSAFFDQDLNGMIELDGEEDGKIQYIYGVDGTEYTKALNTKIARVVKTIVGLYDDKDKDKGFHKANPKIPVNDLGLRTNDNYTFFFKWDNIEAKMKDNGATIAKIVKIINAVYPNIVIDTTKPLFIEALKSVFEAIRVEKFAFDDATGTIVSKAAEIAKQKEADDLAKIAKKAEAKEAKDAEKKAKKAESVNEVASEEVALDLGGEVAAAPAETAAPILGSDAAQLLSGLAPVGK